MKRIIIKSILCTVLFIANLFPSTIASSSQALDRKVSRGQLGDTADLFIAVSLWGKDFAQARHQIIKSQALIVKAAQAKGYRFDSSFIHPEYLHITIQAMDGIKVSDISKYEKCIRTVVDNAEPFDIAQYVQKSYFGLLGSERMWGVLRFDVPKKSALIKIVKRLRYSLKQAGLQVGIYDEYIPHISLGTFKKGLMPDITDVTWAPDIHIHKGGSPLEVQKLDAVITLHMKDEITGVITPKKHLKIFELKKQDAHQKSNQYAERIHEQQKSIEMQQYIINKIKKPNQSTQSTKKSICDNCAIM